MQTLWQLHGLALLALLVAFGAWYSVHMQEVAEQEPDHFYETGKEHRLVAIYLLLF